MFGRPVARWQSGYAAACKAADIGSIPFLASILFLQVIASSCRDDDVLFDGAPESINRGVCRRAGATVICIAY
jgi:hypothetical protein